MASFLLTLTLADTNYNLWTLARAIDNTYRDAPIDSVAVLAPATNANDILLGDANLSATRYGIVLHPDQGFAFNKRSLRGLNARSAGAGQKLAVEVTYKR
jgi:hypothetical protein